MHCLGAIHAPSPAFVHRLAQRASLHLMTPPAETDWFTKCPASGDDLGNDLYGDCVPVAELNAIQVRRHNAWDDTWAPTADEALALYSILTGFNPVTGQPDDGTDTAKAMTAWVQQGIPIDSQNTDSVLWSTIDPANSVEIALAIAHTGPIQVTLNLPVAALDTALWQQAPGTTSDWEPGTWGAHRVLVGAFHGNVRVCRTWGFDVAIHPDFWSRYVISVDAALSREWFDATGLSPAGLDWDALVNDMASFKAVA